MSMTTWQVYVEDVFYLCKARRTWWNKTEIKQNCRHRDWKWIHLQCEQRKMTLGTWRSDGRAYPAFRVALRLNIEALDCRVYMCCPCLLWGTGQQRWQSAQLICSTHSFWYHRKYKVSGIHLPLCQLMYGTRISCILELHFIINHIYLGAVHAHNLTVLSNLMCTVQFICLYYNFLRIMCTMCTMFIINKYILNYTWLPFLNIKIEGLL